MQIERPLPLGLVLEEQMQGPVVGAQLQPVRALAADATANPHARHHGRQQRAVPARADCSGTVLPTHGDAEFSDRS